MNIQPFLWVCLSLLLACGQKGDLQWTEHSDDTLASASAGR